MLLPGTAPTVHAAGISAGQTVLTVNTSVVAFAGHEWWVIGQHDGTLGAGVNPVPNTVTLFAKKLDSEFANKPFRMGDLTRLTISCKQYRQEDGGDDRWYAGTDWTTPNEYAGSSLQQTLADIAGRFPEKEKNVIVQRELAANATADNKWVYGKGKDDYIDGMAGSGISGQMLWPLSESEWEKIKETENDTSVLRYDDDFWLRSPYSYSGLIAMQGEASGGSLGNPSVYYDGDAARPALNLNLSSVLFTSAAYGGKSSATEGGPLVGAEAPTGTVKFTMKDTSQKLIVGDITKSGGTLVAKYSDATVGGNQHISCVLKNDTGEVKYYGKLKQVNNIDANASGTVKIPLAQVQDGNYTLQIFSEEANEDLHTDFCSEPVEMSISVASGIGTVGNTGTGITVHNHSYNNEWESNDTHHWKECQDASCFITANTAQNETYAGHIYDQEVVDSKYLKDSGNCDNPATYYKSCVCGAFTNGGEIFSSGEKAHAWDKVTYTWAADGSSCTAERICSKDQSHKESDSASIKGEVTQAPGCVEKGKTTYTASFTEAWAQSDPAQTKTIADIPAKGHSYAGGKCTVCGAADPNFKAPASAAANSSGHRSSGGGGSQSNVSSPQTGDSSSPGLWLSLMGIGAAGLGGVLLWKKRRSSKGE